MRLLKNLVIGIVALTAILAAVAFVLPRDIEVSRSIVINAAPAKIFPYVNDLRKHPEWSPWAAIDPDAKYSYQGPESGTGQQVNWSSEHPDVGTGSQRIVESVADKRVVTALNFGDMGTAKARFLFEPEGAGTRVTWVFETDAGNNPVMRWMGLMMDRWIGEAFEKGLAKLKLVAGNT